MDYRFAIVYIAVNVFCLIVAAIIVSKFSLNVGSETDIIIFRKMAMCYFAFLLSEAIWGLGVSNIVNIDPTVYGLIKVFGTFFIPLMVYYWFKFALNRFHVEITHKFFKFFVKIPIIILAILYATSYFTGIIYKIDQAGNVIYGPGYAAGGLVDNIYGFMVIATSVILLTKKKSTVERSVYVNQIVFIVICTIGGILDAFVSDTPLMQLAICLSFIYLFIQIQEPHIYHDSLTKLNNRRRTEIFLNDIFENDGKNWHLFMIDIDNFKTANDTYGHIYGDSLLQLVARSLGSVAGQYHRSFISRWGGDEFVFLIQDKREDFTEEFSNKVHEEIDKNRQANNVDFPIHLSIGHAKLNEENMNSIQDFIESADKELYKAKRTSKQS